MSTLAPGTRVSVHKNLHKDLWSARVRGRVVAHLAYVELTGAECRVQEGARQKVIATKTRSVHAYVVGELVASGATVPPRPAGFTSFTYNPYRAGTFQQADGTPVHRARRMRFDREGAWFG